jgi:hypothetical protein
MPKLEYGLGVMRNQLPINDAWRDSRARLSQDWS